MILKICIQAAHVKQIYMLPKSNNFSKCYLICVIINWTVNMPVFCVSEFPSTFVNTVLFLLDVNFPYITLKEILPF